MLAPIQLPTSISVEINYENLARIETVDLLEPNAKIKG
jgi:hypothetical protein